MTRDVMATSNVSMSRNDQVSCRLSFKTVLDASSKQSGEAVANRLNKRQRRKSYVSSVVEIRLKLPAFSNRMQHSNV